MEYFVQNLNFLFFKYDIVFSPMNGILTKKNIFIFLIMRVEVVTIGESYEYRNGYVYDYSVYLHPWIA